MEHYDVVIIGGGLAGASAAEQYRTAGGEGRLVVISADPDLPVNRPPLSKDYLIGEESLDKVFVHPAAFYWENRIEMRLDMPVRGLDLQAKAVHLADGEVLGFGTAVIATGARSRRLPLKGGNLPGVYYLRSLASSKLLRQAYHDAKRAVLVGGGFIGMEVASVLTQRGVECTVLDVGPRVWPQVVPEIVSSFMEGYYRDHGVTLRFGQRVGELRGNDHVDAVVLESGESFPTDLVVVGAGAVLNIGLAQAAGLTVDRAIIVDEYFRTSHPDVYAIGDVTSFPDPIAGRIHVEHWDNALDQGQTLGTTLAGQPTAFDRVAQFFSNVFDLSLNLVGYPEGWDTYIIRGGLKDGQLREVPFRVIYVKEGVVRAVLLVNPRGKLDMGELEAWKALIQARTPANAAVLSDVAVDPRTLLATEVRR
jgi:3-phenylpropionate/trans-cinnamate dioxygenase ferredoxin reductase component